MNKPSLRNRHSSKQAISPLRAATALALLGAFGAFGAACAGSAPPDDGAPPPVYSQDPLPSTVAPVTTAAPGPTAQPTEAPIATSAPTAAPTSAPSASPTMAPTAAPVSGPAGANLHVGSMTVDGLTVEDLACRAEGLGILGSMLVVGGLAKKKGALDACGKGKVHVEWTASKGAVSQVTAKSDNNAKMDACVAKVLKGTAAPFEGECAATVTVGK